jgi:hypothetical protein
MQSTAPDAFTRIRDNILEILNQHALHKETIRIEHCERGLGSSGFCRSRFCPRCTNYWAAKQRKNLETLLPALLGSDPSLQLWWITAAAADSPDITRHARAAALGTQRLLRHPRLKGRIVASFSVLEVAYKTCRVYPCCHTHTLLVTKPMSVGRHRISHPEWVRLWEQVCSLPRLRSDPHARILRSNPAKKNNTSLWAEQAKTTPEDITRLINYSTKWSFQNNLVADFDRQIQASPGRFIERIQQLQGCTRFFGSLSYRTRIPR